MSLVIYCAALPVVWLAAIVVCDAIIESLESFARASNKERPIAFTNRARVHINR